MRDAARSGQPVTLVCLRTVPNNRYGIEQNTGDWSKLSAALLQCPLSGARTDLTSILLAPETFNARRMQNAKQRQKTKDSLNVNRNKNTINLLKIFFILVEKCK